MRSTYRSLFPGLVLATAALLAIPAAAQDSLWTLAQEADETRLVGQIGELGDEHALAEPGGRFAGNLEKREQRRAEEIEEVGAELAEHLAAAKESGSPVELSEALRSAVELEMLSVDHDAPVLAVTSIADGPPLGLRALQRCVGDRHR